MQVQVNTQYFSEADTPHNVDTTAEFILILSWVQCKQAALKQIKFRWWWKWPAAWNSLFSTTMLCHKMQLVLIIGLKQVSGPWHPWEWIRKTKIYFKINFRAKHQHPKYWGVDVLRVMVMLLDDKLGGRVCSQHTFYNTTLINCYKIFSSLKRVNVFRCKDSAKNIISACFEILIKLCPNSYAHIL